MEKQKHTQEKWKIVKCPCDNCEKFCIKIPYNIDGKFDLPDARLIAAAPELLEALEKTIDFFQYKFEGWNCSRGEAIDGGKDWIKFLQQTISKAERS